MIHKNADVNGIIYYDVRKDEEFDVYGFYDCRNTSHFQRLPNVVPVTREGEIYENE